MLVVVYRDEHTIESQLSVLSLFRATTRLSLSTPGGFHHVEEVSQAEGTSRKYVSDVTPSHCRCFRICGISISPIPGIGFREYSEAVLGKWLCALTLSDTQ